MVESAIPPLDSNCLLKQKGLTGNEASCNPASRLALALFDLVDDSPAANTTFPPAAASTGFIV